MPLPEEMECCYTGIATSNGVAIHFFNGQELIPLEPLHAYACGLGWSYGAEKTNTGLSILADYFNRREDTTSARALAEAFANQFLATVSATEVLFIEEHKIADWLRVIRMIEEAA